MDNLTEEAPAGPEKTALQRKRDTLTKKWSGVNDKSTQRQDRLRDANTTAKQYTDELNQFQPWLRSAEDRLSSLGPVTMKPNVVKRQYEVVKVCVSVGIPNDDSLWWDLNHGPKS